MKSFNVTQYMNYKSFKIKAFYLILCIYVAL